MKLYHISLDTDELDKLFIPRVPECAGYGENETIPRICFAPSIKKCIQATHPRDYFIGQRFAVFVLEIDENDPDLIYPERLYEKEYVPDALENEEFWLTRPVFLNADILEVESIDTEIDFAWTCISYIDISNIILNLSDDPKYSHIVKSSYSSKECYERVMHYASEIKDYKMEDECYDKLMELRWSSMRKVLSIDTKLIYLNESLSQALA